MSMKLRGALLVSALAGSLALTTTLPAVAAETSPTFAEAWNEFSEVRSVWTSYGVPETTQEDLVQGFLHGELWDAAAGAEPTSSVESVNDAGAVETVSYFADGSISITTVEQPVEVSQTGGVAARAVTGCTVSNITGGKKYSNCWVDTWVGTIAMSFYATFDIFTNGKDVIRSVYGGAYSLGPYLEVKKETLKIDRVTEISGSSPAQASYRLDVKYFVPLANVPYMERSNYLWLRVAENTYQHNYDVLG